MFNTECDYFPCHKEMEDCDYCYCPLYPCDNKAYPGSMNGKWKMSKKNHKIWDCSECVFPHTLRGRSIIKSMVGNKDGNNI